MTARYHVEPVADGHQVCDRNGPCFGYWSIDLRTCDRWAQALNDIYGRFQARAELVRRRIDRDLV